jgi:hypothetical protein
MRLFFFGAGASKAMGLPLTSELLPKMVECARSGELFAGLRNGARKRQQLLDGISELVPGAASGTALPSIVDILSLIDYALAEGFTILPSGGAAKLRSSRALLEAGLLDVMSKCRHSHFGLENLRHIIALPDTCIVTTNYDFLPDLAVQPLLKDDNIIDYGMAWRDPYTGLIWQRPMSPSTRLLKLHGSVNWLGCPYCEQIYINQAADIALLDTDDDHNEYGDATTCHCGYAPLRRVIISPSLSRGSYQTALRGIHLAALEAMRGASEIYIVGYSLPVEDLMIRSLFLRGISNQPLKPKIQVFQRSAEARARYDMHFGKYEYFLTGFEGFVSALKGN